MARHQVHITHPTRRIRPARVRLPCPPCLPVVTRGSSSTDMPLVIALGGATWQVRPRWNVWGRGLLCRQECAPYILPLANHSILPPWHHPVHVACPSLVIALGGATWQVPSRCATRALRSQVIRVPSSSAASPSAGRCSSACRSRTCAVRPTRCRSLASSTSCVRCSRPSDLTLRPPLYRPPLAYRAHQQVAGSAFLLRSEHVATWAEVPLGVWMRGAAAADE